MPLSSTVIDAPATEVEFSLAGQRARPWSAADLTPQQRSELAVRVLAGGTLVTTIAEEAGTSRTFLYDLAATARAALAEAFGKREEDEPVLFYLPVTKRWIESLVIALVLLCHSSYRGVAELLRDLIGYPISLWSFSGTISSPLLSSSMSSSRRSQRTTRWPPATYTRCASYSRCRTLTGDGGSRKEDCEGDWAQTSTRCRRP